MRSTLFVLAALVASGPAAAQSWEEYAYSEYGISLTFPANPQIEMTSYQIAEGRSVPARFYSVRQDKLFFNLTIADLAGTNLEESVLIDNAIKRVSTGGELKLNSRTGSTESMAGSLSCGGVTAVPRWPQCSITRGGSI